MDKDDFGALRFQGFHHVREGVGQVDVEARRLKHPVNRGSESRIIGIENLDIPHSVLSERKSYRLSQIIVRKATRNKMAKGICRSPTPGWLCSV